MLCLRENEFVFILQVNTVDRSSNFHLIFTDKLALKIICREVTIQQRDLACVEGILEETSRLQMILFL